MAPSDAVNIEDGGSRISGSFNALHNTGVELNNTELMADSQKLVWKAKQQVLGLLWVCYLSTQTRADFLFFWICICTMAELKELYFSVSFQIRWLMSIRSPAKIFFQIIIPPILMISGLLILRGAKNDSQSATGLEPLKLTPEMYLKPGSKESYASFALLQNSTKETTDHVMKYLSDYNVGTMLVSSISSILSKSSHDLYNLGFNILKFPADNLSPSSVSKLKHFGQSI